jgi:phenylalanyl-tRNA synthetase beta chain
MRINTAYLKQFVPHHLTPPELRDLLVSVGIGVARIDSLPDHNAVLEIEITANRPDWLSHRGVAREIAAKRQDLELLPLRQHPVPEITDPRSFQLQITPPDCCRYCGCIIENIEIRESPPAIRQLLESLGQRPINNLVDISNLVMMSTGHPVHFFDLQNIHDNRITVRRARPGESLVLLDGQKLCLTEAQLVIADGRGAVALAGVMGGKSSVVRPETTAIFIESAWFDPINVRKTARQFGLRTEASYRMERGTDIESAPVTLLYTLGLITDQLPQIRITFYQDLYPALRPPPEIVLLKSFPAALTGIDIAPEKGRTILEKLGFGVSDGGNHWVVTVPSFRPDVTIKQDLVEEIIRIHGYDTLESKVPLIETPAILPDRKRTLVTAIRTHLVHSGYSEAINYIFHSPEENRFFAGQGADLSLKNPLGRELSTLKNSLISGLLRNIAHNVNQGFSRTAFFELGKTFVCENGQPVETEVLALAVSGIGQAADWQKPAEAFTLISQKSHLENLFQRLRLTVRMTPGSGPGLIPKATLAILAGEEQIGFLGEVRPEVRSYFTIDFPVFVAELRLAPLLAAFGENRFIPWNRFPGARRDFSFIMANHISYERLSAIILSHKPAILESFDLIDVFENAKLPTGMVALTLSFQYRSGERTLTGEEVQETHSRLVESLIQSGNLIPR